MANSMECVCTVWCNNILCNDDVMYYVMMVCCVLVLCNDDVLCYCIM